jgi:glucose-6-phosphate isomerase
MLTKINPTKTKAWKKLRAHYRVMRKMRMADMFRNDPKRSSSFSLRFEDILVDFSKNIITRETLAILFETKETLDLLFELAGECRVNTLEL